MLVLDPLVILSVTDKLDSIEGDAELRIGEDVVRSSKSACVHHLAVHLRVYLGRVSEFYTYLLRFFEHTGSLDRSALVPEQQDSTCNEHDKAHSDAAEGVLHPGTVRCGCYFLVSHKTWLLLFYVESESLARNVGGDSAIR